MANNPSDLGVGNAAGQLVPRGPGSGDLEVPQLSTREHLELLVGLIINEWKKNLTKTKLGNLQDNLSAAYDAEKLTIYNPVENCLIKVCVDKLPEALFRKVDCLEHMQRVHIDYLEPLVRLLKEDLDKVLFLGTPDSNTEGDGRTERYLNSEGAEMSFVDLLAELAKHRLQTEYGEAQEHLLELEIVLVDGFGKLRKIYHRIHPNTDFASFLAEMENMTATYGQDMAWAPIKWDKRIQNLKGIGLASHPGVIKIEQLIATHKARDYNYGPKWRYYKDNGRLVISKDIEDEDTFKKIMGILTKTKEQDQVACLIRVVDAKLVEIFSELRHIEIQQGVQPSEKATLPDTQGEQYDTLTGGGYASGSEAPGVGDMLFDPTTQTIGDGVFWVATGDDDDEELCNGI